jgi:DNA-binding CsgD family transcriptional regulator
LEKDLINGLIDTKDETEVAMKLKIQESTLNMMLLDLFHRYDVKTTEELITLLKVKHLI